jgi:signal transduction histidine kinase
MDSLLSGLLKLSRTGRADLQMEDVDMNSLMTDIYNTMEFQIRESGAKVEIEELPPCKGDKVLISQIFSNLLTNALKYLDKGRESIIKVSGSKKNGGSIYYVEDNGIGISPEHHKKIFEIFYQLDPSRNDDEGLGLTIVKKIIRKHRGKVWVESELGKGSKFFVSLPKA